MPTLIDTSSPRVFRGNGSSVLRAMHRVCQRYNFLCKDNTNAAFHVKITLAISWEVMFDGMFFLLDSRWPLVINQFPDLRT